jgi:cytochrome c-type biogenesis protein CcmH
MRHWLLTLLLLAAAPLASAGGVEPRPFATVEHEARYRALIHELRCLVCQNQSLAESDADLAKDLRDQTYQMIQQGKDDDEIVAYMVNRYGDFVLYRPPVSATTLLLWVGPGLLAAVGALVLLFQVRRRRHVADTAVLTEDEVHRVRDLLKTPGQKP